MFEYAITTVDNPFDPFKEFDDWLMFDMDHDYNSCSRLARIVKTSDSFSDEENNLAIEKAIDEIVLNDPLKLYKKVKQKVNKIDENFGKLEIDDEKEKIQKN